MGTPRDPITKEQRSRSTSLMQAISDLYDGKKVPNNLPDGVEKIERATTEAVRLKLHDKVDGELLSEIAEAEGYTVEKGSFAPRVIKDGEIIARIGSKSDAGGSRDLYLYLFPPETETISVYRKVVAEREGILDPSCGTVDLERLISFNLRVITLASKYLKKKYSR